MAAERIDKFVTRMWRFDVGDLAPHFDAWTREVLAWRQATPQPAGRSNRLGWNSPQDLFTRPSFAPLREVAAKHFLEAMQEMIPSGKLSFQLVGWVNLHDTGGFNTLHAHPRAMLSGCFYLQAPQGSGPLVFRDPRPGVTLDSFQGRGVNCVEDFEVEPRQGHLYVFPHWLEHRVEPNGAAEPRISIGINAIRA